MGAISALYVVDSGRAHPDRSAPRELLELLQAQPLLTGREIADRLGVDRQPPGATSRRSRISASDRGQREASAVAIAFDPAAGSRR